MLNKIILYCILILVCCVNGVTLGLLKAYLKMGNYCVKYCISIATYRNSMACDFGFL